MAIDFEFLGLWAGCVVEVLEYEELKVVGLVLDGDSVVLSYEVNYWNYEKS